MLRTLTTMVLALAWHWPAIALNADTKIGLLSCTLSEPSDALTPDGVSAERTRDAICAFSSESGEHETYTGKITGVSITPQGQSTLIWVVRSPSDDPVRPGALQRTFTSDSGKPVDQKPPLVGDGDAEVALHSLSDSPEGAVSATQKPAPTGFVILRLELTLSSTGA